MNRILIMGIGNTLLGDEGAGIHLLRAAQEMREHQSDDGEQKAIPELDFLDAGTLSFTLAPTLESYDRLIVLDAAELSEVPGSFRCLEDEDMDHFLGTAKRSVHEVGLLDLLTIARLSDRLPQKRALIAIQPETLEWGDKPSPSVAQMLPNACDALFELVDRWSTSA